MLVTPGSKRRDNDGGDKLTPVAKFRRTEPASQQTNVESMNVLYSLEPHHVSPRLPPSVLLLGSKIRNYHANPKVPMANAVSQTWGTPMLGCTLQCLIPGLRSYHLWFHQIVDGPNGILGNTFMRFDRTAMSGDSHADGLVWLTQAMSLPWVRGVGVPVFAPFPLCYKKAARLLKNQASPKLLSRATVVFGVPVPILF